MQRSGSPPGPRSPQDAAMLKATKRVCRKSAHRRRALSSAPSPGCCWWERRLRLPSWGHFRRPGKPACRAAAQGDSAMQGGAVSGVAIASMEAGHGGKTLLLQSGCFLPDTTVVQNRLWSVLCPGEKELRCGCSWQIGAFRVNGSSVSTAPGFGGTNEGSGIPGETVSATYCRPVISVACRWAKPKPRCPVPGCIDALYHKQAGQ